MTSAEKKSLSDVSQAIKEMLAITRDQFRQQDEADERACVRLVNVADGR